MLESVLDIKLQYRDFPGGSVAKTPCSQCGKPGFIPG